MNRRAALRLPKAPTAEKRLETVERLATELLAAIQRGASPDNLVPYATTIKDIACVGAAYERRRERGEPTPNTHS